jgi:hypothetical protein
VIAISYRREDSLPIAGRLYDRLQAKFGNQNVFMDFDSIPAGADFREQIKRTIEGANIVVAVIGNRWFGEQADSSRRIDDPADFVRLEMKYALDAGVPIIPLLIDNTSMPKPEKLPSDIEGLAFRNALPLDSGLDFHNHAERLIKSICKLVDVGEVQGAGASIAESNHEVGGTRNKRAVVPISVGVSIGIVAIAIWYWGFFLKQADRGVTSRNDSHGSPTVSPATKTSESSTRTAPVVKAGPVYKGVIRAEGGQDGSGTPLTISLAEDRKSGTMTQTSKSGDTVVKFSGVWDEMTFHAVTDEVVAKPKNIQWKPESFILRFVDDWKRASYECNSEGIVYTAELALP